jgi:hypothetical protein
MPAETPLLFGVDPDEIWELVPEEARKIGQKTPVILLKAPSLATTVQYEALVSDRRKATLALDPTVLQEIETLTDRKYKIDPLPEGSSEEEAQAYIEKVRQFVALSARWAEAYAKTAPQFKEREEVIDLRILSEAIAGWRELPTASGKMIDFEKVKSRIGEVLRGALRRELIEAALAGTTVSEQDAEGLQSSPASQAA